MMFKKIDVEIEEPKVGGKYIVFTKTRNGNVNKFETTYYPPKGKKKRGSWGCTNQVVTHWLKEV